MSGVLERTSDRIESGPRPDVVSIRRGLTRNQGLVDRRAAMQSTEIWRVVPGYNGVYLASNRGRIWSMNKKRMLSQSTAGAGYLRVGIPCGKGRTTSGYVHRLVALAFHGEPQPGQEVRHLDNDPTNNTPNNLAWGSHSQNMADQESHGTLTRQRTHCKRGHEYTPENTGWVNARRGRFRVCLACAATWGKAKLS